MMHGWASSPSLLGRNGKRKYLTRAEQRRFLAEAQKSPDDIANFCIVMAATGCRISEALSLSARSFDLEAGIVVIESLKKRQRGIFREVPLPPYLLKRLDPWLAECSPGAERLWPWVRMTGYRRICEIMGQAQITGEQATPKGLRHGFAVVAIQSGVPLNMVQRWLGHADMKTTAIYAWATGPEEQEIAARMWDDPPPG